MELEAEVHSHPHKVGNRWIDLTLAISALVLSIGSIILSIENEANMKRLVTANSWPYIQLSHGNEDVTGKSLLHFDASDAGVGPAILEKLVVSYDGQPMASAPELLQRCCGSTGHLGDELMRNMATGHVFAPRESLSFLAISRTDTNAAVYDRLAVERFKIELSACYSSVFGEHWITSMRHPKPQSAESCEQLPGKGYESALYDGDP